MNPSNLIDYQILNKNKSNIIKSLILDNEHNYLYFRKSKKGKAIKYVKINYQILRLLSTLKSLFHITHFKKYSDMLAPFTKKTKYLILISMKTIIFTKISGIFIRRS